MSKKAVLVVSFGTSFKEAVVAIENIENRIQKAFSEYDFFRAFTSGMIIRKIKRVQGIDIFNPEGAMDYLIENGYEEAFVQPTHIISGKEFDKMISMLAPYQDKLHIEVGKPLLTEKKDYEDTCRIVMDEVPQPLPSGEAFVLMGHGTDHHANGAYSQFEDMLKELGYESAFVGTVEGTPDLLDVIRRLHLRKIDKVYLMPLMVVAGDHARNDLAGDKEDSWESILKAEGFKTEVILKGLGEIDAIADLFVDHLKHTTSLEKYTS